MLLVFPSVASLPVADDSVCVIRGFNRFVFNRQVAAKVRDGWVVHEMTSSFKRTLFGGVVTYKAELRKDGSSKR